MQSTAAASTLARGKHLEVLFEIHNIVVVQTDDDVNFLKDVLSGGFCISRCRTDLWKLHQLHMQPNKSSNLPTIFASKTVYDYASI